MPKETADTNYAVYVQGDQKVSVHLMITVQKTRNNILNSFSHNDNVVRMKDNRWR
jgi:hypothetical protein